MSSSTHNTPFAQSRAVSFNDGSPSCSLQSLPAAAGRVGRDRDAARELEGLRRGGDRRNLAVTANAYTHVLTDDAELDYRALLFGANPVGGRSKD
jgi:hypothetical protein